jgi:hypothetical protein
LLVFTHRENIKRLLDGTEQRLTGSHLAGSYKRPGSGSPAA